MKKYILLSLSILVIFMLVGCKNKKEIVNKEYSLKEVYTKLNDYYSLKNEYDENVSLYYIDENENVIVIVLLNNSNENQKKFLEEVNFDSKYFKFVTGEFKLYDAESIKKNGIASNNAQKIYSLFGIDNTNNYIYPDYIGGMYIDEGNNLVLQIVKDKIPNIESQEYKIYTKIISISNEIVIKYVTYSYNELKEKLNEVTDMMKTNEYFKTLNVSMWSVDIKNNGLFYGVVNYDENVISKIRDEYKNSLVITFEQKGNVVTSSDWKNYLIDKIV